MIVMRWQLALALGLAGLLSLPASWGQEQASPEPANSTTPSERANLLPGQVVVTFVNGELTIKANNAAINEVLRRVSAAIGAELDFSQGAEYPVVVDLGPGPPKKVISALLEWAPYDYVIARSEDNPEAVANVMVFPKTPRSGDANSRVPLVQAKENQPKQGSVSAKDANVATIAKNSSVNPLSDLIGAAKDEAARSTQGTVSLYLEGDAGDGSEGTPTQVNIDDLFNKIEAQLNATASQAPTDSSTGVPPASPRPPGRRRR